jgi:hypothetical protein
MGRYETDPSRTKHCKKINIIISHWRDRCAPRIGPMNYTQAKMGTSVFQTFRVTDCRILHSTTVRNKFMSENANASKIRREIMNPKNMQKMADRPGSGDSLGIFSPRVLVQGFAKQERI